MVVSKSVVVFQLNFIFPKTIGDLQLAFLLEQVEKFPVGLFDELVVENRENLRRVDDGGCCQNDQQYLQIHDK